MWGIYTGKCLARKMPRAIQKGGDKVGAGRETGCGGNDTHGGHRYVCEGVWLCFRVRKVSHWMVEINYCFSGGCLLSLSLGRWGFQKKAYNKQNKAKV
jgi:hypothetical protein